MLTIALVFPAVAVEVRKIRGLDGEDEVGVFRRAADGEGVPLGIGIYFSF